MLALNQRVVGSNPTGRKGDKMEFVVQAEVKCEDCGGSVCSYCGFKGFNRDRVKFITDEDDKIIEAEVV